MKILNLPEDIVIFLLRDINCHTRIQSILKSYEKVSSSKTNFSKIQALWAVAQFYIKIFGLHFVNSILDNNHWRYNK